jgi:hypothetical protein
VETARRFIALKNRVAQALNENAKAFPRWRDRLMAIYYPSLLAGPDTQITNFVGNLWKGGIEAFNETIRRMLTGEAKPADYLMATGQMSRIVAEAVTIEGQSALRTGVSGARVEGKFKDAGYRYSAEQLESLPVIGPMLSKLKYIGNSMAATDSAFYHVAKENALLMDMIASGATQDEAVAKLGLDQTAAFEAQARAKYAELGETPTDNQVKVLALELRDDFRRANEVDLEAGYRAGREATFTGEIKSPAIRMMVNALNSAKTKFPVLNFFVPFTTIAGAITDNALDYMPLSSAIRFIGAFAEAKNTGTPEAQVEYQRAAIKLTEGSLLTLGLIAILLAEADKEEKDRVLEIHGPGPRDFKKNAQWRETGHRAFHLRIGGVWVDYRVTPGFLALGTLGGLLDAIRYEREGGKVSAQEVIMAYSLGTLTVTAEQSFLKGVKDLLDIAFETNPQQKLDKMKDTGASILTNALVPGANFFRQMHKLTDPTVRQTDHSFPAKLMAQTPLLSAFLPEKVSALGSVVMGDRPVVDRLALFGGPDPATNPDDVRVFETLIAKDIWLTMPSVRETSLINKSDLRRSEYRRLAPEMSGKTMDIEQVSQFIKERGARFKARALPRLEAWGKLDRETVKAEVAKLMDQASREARRVVLGLNPRR